MSVQNQIEYSNTHALTSALHPFSARYKAMLYLTAYFDESGDEADPTRNFMGMAGFVASADVWKQVESEWQAVVSSPDFALTEYFHMKDFAYGARQFKGWQQPRKDRLHKALIAILVRAEVEPVGAIVQLEAYSKLTLGQRQSFRNPYALVAQECIHFSAFMGLLPKPEKVAMVFAHQKTYGAVQARGEANPDQAGNLENLFYGIKKLTDSGQWMGAYGVSTPQESIPLQAADMLAWELTKEFETILQVPPPREMRGSLKELLRAGGQRPLIRLFDHYELLRTVKRSGFPDQTGTSVVDDDSLLHNAFRRATQEALLVRRGYESDEHYIPKWRRDALME